MRYLTTTELQSAYSTGAVLAVAFLPDGTAFEVHVVTASGDFVLVANDGRHPMRFYDKASAVSRLSDLGIVHIDSPEAWEVAKIKAALAGLRNGANRVFTVDEWAAIRAARQASRGLS